MVCSFSVLFGSCNNPKCAKIKRTDLWNWKRVRKSLVAFRSKNSSLLFFFLIVKKKRSKWEPPYPVYWKIMFAQVPILKIIFFSKFKKVLLNPLASFAHRLRILCTSFAHHLHILCTSFAHPLHIVCASSAHHLRILCTSFAHHLHILCTSFAHPLYILCTSSAHPFRSLPPQSWFGSALQVSVQLVEWTTWFVFGSTWTLGAGPYIPNVARVEQ